MAAPSFRRGYGRVFDPRSSSTVEGAIELAGRNITVNGHVVNDDGSRGGKVEKTFAGLAVEVTWLDAGVAA